MTATAIHGHLLAVIDRIVTGKHWAWRAALVLTLSSLLLHFPSYGYLIDHLVGGSDLPEWNNVLAQRDHLLHPKEHPPETHRAKTVFRLTVPFLARILSLDIIGLMVLSSFIGVLGLVLSLLLAQRITQDRQLAFLFTTCLAMTYAGSAAFFDVWGFFDAFGYFFLLLALYAGRKWYLVFTAVLLAAFTDERALIASSAVLLYHWHEHRRLGDRTIPWSVVACAAAWFVYFLCRWSLAIRYDFKTHTDLIGLPSLEVNEPLVMWSAWMMFEGGWLMILPFLVLPFLRSGQRSYVPFAFCAAVIFVVGLCVMDITRSLAYGSILLFPALRYAKDTWHTPQLHRVLLFAAVISTLQPMNFTLGGREISSVDPLPIKVLFWLLER